MKIKPKKENPRCPACDSKNIVTNKDSKRFCRRCGHEWRKS